MSWASNATWITFTLEASVSGWLGVGLNTVPLMAGADIYVGWVDGTSSAVTMLDMHASGHSVPIVDSVSNIAAVSGGHPVTMGRPRGEGGY